MRVLAGERRGVRRLKMRSSLLLLLVLTGCGGLFPLARDVSSVQLEIQVDNVEPSVGEVLQYRRWLKNTSPNKIRICTIDREAIVVWGTGGPRGGHAGAPTHVSCIPSRTFTIRARGSLELPEDTIPVNPEIGLGSAWTRAMVDIADPYACTLDRCPTYSLSSQRVDLQVRPSVVAPN